MAIIQEDIIGGRGGYGFGGGGEGGLGLIALLALLGINRGGNGGLFGGSGGSGIEGLNNINSTIDSAAILSKLATIEGAVPLSEAQVQLALAGVQSTLSGQANQNTQYIGTQLNSLALGQLVQSNAIQTAIASVDTNVDRQSCAIQNAVHADGEATRALITNNLISALQADKVILANEVTELRHEGARERDRHGIEITLTQNQNQNQLQFQAQAQVLQGLTNALIEVGQIARATNSNVIVGNAGASTTGAQTASPTNVRA